MKRPHEKVLSISGTILRESEMAILFALSHISDRELQAPVNLWFPLSQISKIMRPPPASEEKAVLIISDWIAQKKNLSTLPYKDISDDDIPF